MQNVLIIDDNRELLELNAAFLSSLRAVNVTAASDSILAVRALKNENFDLVISDFRMPNLTGLDVITALRQKDPQALIPVIILTGYAGQLHPKKEQMLNVYIMEKPVQSKQLAQKALELLSQRLRTQSGAA